MTSRRRFIQSGIASGIAASALSSPAVASLAAGFEANARTALPLDRFVLDERFADGLEIAKQAALCGVPVARISGDLTDLWYNDLDLRWKAAPRALAGVTTSHGLFVLETLAADHRMSVVYRGEHRVPRNGHVVHLLSGPAGLIASARPAPGNPAWHSLLGRAMTACPTGRPAAAKLEWTTSASSASNRDETLYSWIIAPRSAVALPA